MPIRRKQIALDYPDTVTGKARRAQGRRPQYRPDRTARRSLTVLVDDHAGVRDEAVQSASASGVFPK